jgi:hypothetical protein
MMAVSDGVVIGIVLGLVFAAVSYYLHTRLTQLEKKVGYMEGILLDLKVTTEQAILSASEPSGAYAGNDLADGGVHVTSLSGEENESETRHIELSETPRIRTPTPAQTPFLQQSQEQEQAPSSTGTSVSVNYESMTYKELQQLARQRNISGIRNLSKAQVIEIIRSHDNGTAVAPSAAPAPAPVPLTSWKTDTEEQGTNLEQLTSMDSHVHSNGLSDIQDLGSDEPEMTLVGNE